MTAKTNLPKTDAQTTSEGALSLQQPQGAMSLWRKSNKPVTLSIPTHWHDQPNCGEYQTTLDESDPKQSKMVALALGGKSVRAKNCMNKRYKVVGFTMKPYMRAVDDQGCQSGDIGFILHTEKESVFCGHYHAEADILALVGRLGMPTLHKPIEVVIDPVPEADTYRVLASDLVD